MTLPRSSRRIGGLVNRFSPSMLARIALLGAVALLGAACSTDANPVVTIDDVSIAEADFAALHVETDDLDADELAGSTLLLVLHHAFTLHAREDLGVEPDRAVVDQRFAERTVGFEARGDIDEQLALRNLTQERVQLEAELDALQEAVTDHLVRTEAPGFDLAGAYDAYLLDEAEVCVMQIQIADASHIDGVLERLAAGESFDEVARDVSIDSFVDREPGLSGAGGDFGCSAPGSLAPGLGQAAITAPLDQPVAPVVSGVGVHVLWVYGRTVPLIEDVKPAVLEHAVPLQGQEMFRLWAVDVLQSIEVEVDEAYGRWAMLPETDPVRTVVPEYLYGAIISD